MDYGQKSDLLNMHAALSITARLGIAVVILGILGHLTITLGERVGLYLNTDSTHATQPTHSRGTDVRRLANARARLQTHPHQAEAALLDLVTDSSDPQIREAVAQSLVTHAASDWPQDKRGRFIQSIAGAAILSGHVHRIPPSITIAQAIHESGWGRSSLARKHHNLFGMKASNTQAGVMYPTLEYTKSGVRVDPARFRTYTDPAESMAEHAVLLATSPRYATTQAYAQNWRAYLSVLAPIYATDPKYPSRITQLIERYSLDRWDSVVGDEAPGQPPS